MNRNIDNIDIVTIRTITIMQDLHLRSNLYSGRSETNSGPSSPPFIFPTRHLSVTLNPPSQRNGKKLFC